MNRVDIEKIAFHEGVDLFGVASVERFEAAPKGFHPQDIYPETKSVIAFAIKIPGESIFARNPVPYTQLNTMAMMKMDMLTYQIADRLDRKNIKSVIIPTDDPYLSWDEENQHGKGILSLRHVGFLAGLGKLGKNNLLINNRYGNMIQIGALLTNERIAPSPFADYNVCPDDCQVCLNNCPREALTGTTVVQKKCRPVSNFTTQKGQLLKKCFECRKNCPSAFGIKY